ncbi:MAG TPA: hypothetical protein VF629_12310 [Hymenobacter sp.]|jgi:hypothetical protein|uniref:hypothetical protein n=1 Tax=Hymenobacter sp. TaxID=1898978 RepID=UPI002EDB3DF9
MKRCLLPALLLFLIACKKNEAPPDPAANYGRPIVGTWALQTVRVHATYLGSARPDTDVVSAYPAGSDLTYDAGGNVTRASNGAQVVIATYTLRGTTLTTTYPGYPAAADHVSELTAQKLVVISTSENGGIRSVVTKTATR